ncbi:MAG: hypothetical protein KKB50_08215 [Planctomycetes bacterium]|nr:hypothetical protein [Planctomycetota bacterium]
MPRCPNCDYDLTGLELPHRCPECGHLSDPEQERAAAVAWYCYWKGLFFRRPPPMALAYLGNPACRRQARRRYLTLVLLPWLAVTCVLLMLNSVEIVHKHERWWETPELPGEKLNHKVDVQTDRVLAFNFHLGPFFLDFGSGSELLHRKTNNSLRLSWPHPDNFTWIVFLAPPVFGVVGIYLLGLTLLGDRALRGQIARVGSTGPAWVLAALLAPWLITALLLHFLVAICFSVDELDFLPSIVSGMAVAALIWTALAVYALGALIVLSSTLLAQRPRRRGFLVWGAAIVSFIVWAVTLGGSWFLMVLLIDLLD